MNIDVIHANQLTADYIKAWSDLQRTDSRIDNPFFRPEFTQLVARVCDNVEVAVLKENGKLVGFFPFQRERGAVGHPVGWRLSDMNGCIVDHGIKWSVEEVLKSAGLLTWHFDHLLASQKQFQSYHAFVEDSPYIDLSAGYEAYQNERRRSGSSTISQAMRKSRKIEKELGPLHFERHTTEPQVLEALVEWKRHHIARRRYLDIFKFQWVIELLQKIARSKLNGFSGILSGLYAGDRLIAVHLGIRSYHVISSLIPTFDPAFSKYSPGIILHLELAKKAAESGVKRIDLGRGYNQMKASLMSGAIPVAIGSVELRPINRVLRTGWYGARELVHSTPLRGVPLRMYRRLRNWIAYN